MAPSADPVDSPSLPSPILTPTNPTKTLPSLAAEISRRLSTVPSDEERSSEDDSFRSSPGRPERSNSSSFSEVDAPDARHEVRPASAGLVKSAQTPDQPATNTASAPLPTARSRRSSSSATNGVHKLSATEMQDLASSPESLPVAPAPARNSIDQEQPSQFAESRAAIRQSILRHPDIRHPDSVPPNGLARGARDMASARDQLQRPRPATTRTVSTPPTTRNYRPESRAMSPRRYSFQPSPRLAPLHLPPDALGVDHIFAGPRSGPPAPPSQPPASSLPQPTSPVPTPVIPLPPMSLPTHLQLELAAQRPSPLYIAQSSTADLPYESSAVKFERLKNVLFLPPYLERTLYFGALACLDAWLYTFTILPIRFVSALWILIKWWGYVIGKEARWVSGFVWYGIGRLWERERGRGGERSRRPSELSETMRSRSCSIMSENAVDNDAAVLSPTMGSERPQPFRRTSQASSQHARIKVALAPLHAHPGPRTGIFRHRRTKSMPSNLSPFNKADLLQGSVILFSSMALMWLDASRMYHFIRAQSAIKLYVIYNILEVGDRLLSAVGQDILECLFSSETLSRDQSGRSKVLMPLGMFLLALAYNCLHSIALYYQVITLNVAVNSYSNALLTLLLSNQFVEIKSTVFKRIEKDNLFQLTCADIVERFQLWIMLLIIGMRNVVEVGGLSVPGAGLDVGPDDAGPKHTSSNMPASFTIIPSWLMSGEVLSPFLIVIGSEMLVDAIKHAYVSKFNNIKPRFYSRILDILCKDYYQNAFTTPSLTRRLGLAVIPLSCLFIRATIQTYGMFLTSHVPMPAPPTTQTSLSDPTATPSSPAVLAALNRFDTLLRDSLGRATYGYPYGSPLNSRPWYSWTSDDMIAALTMVVFFFILFLVLLILKLLLGMVLLRYARNRFQAMQNAEHAGEKPSYDTTGKRVGGFGQVELGQERQRWIHADKAEGLPGHKGFNPGGGEKKKPETDLNGVFRYEMVAKRIW